MVPAAIGESLALVETIATFGTHRISFERDPSDSFVVKVDRLTTDGADPGKDELLPLLPRGSGWNPAVGWRSFVVLPFSLPGICAGAVGVEGVVPHPSRGAFPVMRVFLLRAADIPSALVQLAAGLSTGALTAASLPEQKAVVWSSEAQTPEQHQRLESLMLLTSAEAWRRGQAHLLRTLLLSDDQVPWPHSLSQRLRAFPNPATSPPYLVATVPSIRAQFSRATKLTLLLKQLLD